MAPTGGPQLEVRGRERGEMGWAGVGIGPTGPAGKRKKEEGKKVGWASLGREGRDDFFYFVFLTQTPFE